MANTGQYDSQTNIELEDYEREIFVQPEAAVIYGGSVVNSVNGQTGDVTLTTSDLENTSDYQDGQQVADAINTAIAGKQDILTAGTGIDITSDVVSVDTTTIATQSDLEGKQNVLTPGDNIQIDGDTISATDTTYNAGTGLDLSGTTFSVDTSTIATHQDITDEATARENADTNLQGQIDALTVSSDVIDVLGTYQDLQNYDTSHVKENDIIKVLQDSTHSNAMSYYKWVITSNVGAWVYVGSEGPFYTKNEADVLLNSKQNTEDNSLETFSKTIVGAINEVDSIAKGANQALSFASYAAMVTEFNSLDDDVYNVGQNIYIQTLEVPDLWISSVESTSTTYTYVDDATFVSGLDTNGYVQVGYYKLSALETQKVDLTNYVTNTDYATSSNSGVFKVSNGVMIGSTGYISCNPRTYADYTGLSNSYFIAKGTLENVITGKGLISNTDYANSTTGGVFKTSSAYGQSITSNGQLFAVTKAYSEYVSANNAMFISKGTLENVVAGKELDLKQLSTFDRTKTQVLKNINGSLIWVDE